MVTDYSQGYVKPLRSALLSLVYPLHYVVNLPAAAAGRLTAAFTDRETLLADNARLEQERLLLNSKLQRYEVLKAENHRLRELLESSLRLTDRVRVAELVAVDLQAFRRRILINKGRREGAYEGQPVVDARGIMGQIMRAGPFSSTVLLITDTNHALPVQVNRNGLRAIAVGSGRDDTLMLKHVPHNADIRPGDLIISSGLGRRFPAGYPVGEIERITSDPGTAFATVTIRPSARLGRSREVLLVWPRVPTDLTTRPAPEGQSEVAGR